MVEYPAFVCRGFLEVLHPLLGDAPRQLDPRNSRRPQCLHLRHGDGTLIRVPAIGRRCVIPAAVQSLSLGSELHSTLEHISQFLTPLAALLLFINASEEQQTVRVPEHVPGSLSRMVWVA